MKRKVLEKLDIEDFNKQTEKYIEVKNLLVKTYDNKRFLPKTKLLRNAYFTQTETGWVIKLFEDENNEEIFFPCEIEEAYAIYDQTDRVKHAIDYSEYDDTNVITLADGTEIEFRHESECCEIVYADLNALNDTGFFEDMSIRRNNIQIEFVKGYGIRLNGYGIPCYNRQNGYYSSDIDIYIKTPWGKIEEKLCFNCDENDIWEE